MKKPLSSLVALFFVALSFGPAGCEASSDPPDPSTTPASPATPAPTDGEELDTTAEAVTLSCGVAFDCRTHPPDTTHSWNFYGSYYCKESGSLRCKFVQSGLQAGWPVYVYHTVPSTCRTCTSNTGSHGDTGSPCALNPSDTISNYAWTCVAP